MNKEVAIELIGTLGEYETKNKYITFNFFNILSKFSLEGYQDMVESMDRNSEILREVNDIVEERDKFREFYIKVLDDMGFYDYRDEDINIIVNSLVGNSYKISYYAKVLELLREIVNRYRVVLLVDDFPSIYSSLESNYIDRYVDEIYVSSCYGVGNCRELWDKVRNKDKDFIYIDSYDKLREVAYDNI